MLDYINYIYKSSPVLKLLKRRKLQSFYVQVTFCFLRIFLLYLEINKYIK